MASACSFPITHVNVLTVLLQAGTAYRSVAYFVNWAIYGRNHQPQDLPVENLTHVLYAFANVRPENGEVIMTDPWSDTDKHYDSDTWDDAGTNLYGCLKQLYLLKKRNRHLKVLLSIGGWSYSSNLAEPASTDACRQTFASSAVSLLKNLGFDGLDIDWEYPQSDTEAHDFVLLLQATRAALDAYAATLPHAPRLLLTIACPAGPQNYSKLDVATMDRELDFWNLMAYDYAGSWHDCAAHQANLHPSGSNPACTPVSTSAAVQWYVERGVASGKIVLGMPLYGRAFLNTAGPGTPFRGTGEGNWEHGVWDYKALPRPETVVHQDMEIGASWCMDDDGLMVSYDTREVGDVKAEYIMQNGLGGAMWWETSGDKTGEESLIGSVIRRLGGHEGGAMDRTENYLAYPESKYDNLREGFPNE